MLEVLLVITNSDTGTSKEHLLFQITSQLTETAWSSNFSRAFPSKPAFTPTNIPIGERVFKR